MLVKIEPSGCTERKGLVQIRFWMYLESGDYGYEKHHVRVPERPLTDAEGADPVLADLVPKIWQNNPFHNHFIYAEPEISDKVIMDIGQAFLEDAYIKWASEEKVEPKNPPVKFPTSFNNTKVITKVRHLKATKLERSI